MDERLRLVREKLQANGHLAELAVREEAGELHLMRGDDCFARLIPTDREEIWRMEYFRNIERWECLDFQGTLEECLDFLFESEHYRFWNG